MVEKRWPQPPTARLGDEPVGSHYVNPRPHLTFQTRRVCLSKFYSHSSISLGMLWRVRNSRGRPKNAPAAFIQPCRPTVAKRPPRGEGWAHELKHDGYRLQIHVRHGRVR